MMAMGHAGTQPGAAPTTADPEIHTQKNQYIQDSTAFLPLVVMSVIMYVIQKKYSSQ